jgi:hypothetical protein
VALTPSEIDTINKLQLERDLTMADDERNLRYYRGAQRVEQLGMAIPPSMRRFLVVVNWPRVVVDTIEHRQNVRSLVLPGQEEADPSLRAIWDASNLSAHLKMFNRDRMIFGRAFMSVGTNEKDKSLPLVRVESPQEMAALVDIRREVVTAAARFYGAPLPPYLQSRTIDTAGVGASVGYTSNVTLYLPNATIWAKRSGSDWVEIDRDDHELGTVPVVMHLNRRMSGSWAGESQISDIIPITDSAARTLTNLQFTIEAHGSPRKFMIGVEQKDFLDSEGNPIPQWEAYFDAIHMIANKDGKIGQLEGASVDNFEKALNMYGQQAATLTGFPARYFGQFTTNPPAEGAIRADEAQLVESVEGQNEEVGMTLGWVAALALRFATGQTVDGNQIRVDWFDPATPTYSQRADAISKMMAGPNPVLSREGAWDELGWSEARKAKERARFEAQDQQALTDPITALILKQQAAGADANAGTGA